MDFMKWISSLDELLYEVMSWLLFFPLTLWRTATRPLAMMAYADQQLALPEAEQYGATLSPPLFLALALLAAHGVSLALGQADGLVASKHGLGGLVNDDASAMIVRMVVFASFPLFAAARLLRRRGVPIDRASLRLPFYAQCYPVAVFALAFSVGVSLSELADRPSHIAAGVTIVASLVYYAVLETRWFARQLSIGPLRAAGNAGLVFAQGVAMFLFVAFLFSR